MSPLQRVLAYTRLTQLSIEMTRVEKVVQDYQQDQRHKLALALAREMKAAAAAPEPHLYQSSENSGYRDWGDGTRLGMHRVKSKNPDVQVCGIALWLAVAYHETLRLENTTAKSIHRRIIRISRELKEFSDRPRSRAERAEDVMAARQTATGY
ncbi:MAG: hypothetical protein AAGE01_11285 [Pseudomonadota bacterium]